MLSNLREFFINYPVNFNISLELVHISFIKNKEILQIFRSISTTTAARFSIFKFTDQTPINRRSFTNQDSQLIETTLLRFEGRYPTGGTRIGFLARFTNSPRRNALQDNRCNSRYSRGGNKIRRQPSSAC